MTVTIHPQDVQDVLGSLYVAIVIADAQGRHRLAERLRELAHDYRTEMGVSL